MGINYYYSKQYVTDNTLTIKFQFSQKINRESFISFCESYGLITKRASDNEIITIRGSEENTNLWIYEKEVLR